MTAEPKYTPKSELTLSAAPENLQVPSGPLTDLRSERDPLTPGLIRELAGVRRTVTVQPIEARHGDGCSCEISETELRALWGDR